MIRCGLYIRVSTDMQKERGESLEVQLKRLNAYAEAKEWAVVETYKDAGISAKNTNRPEFNRMRSDIEEGKLDAILCTKLDRLFRNTKDFLDVTDYFEQKNIMFVCLEGNIDTSSPAGRVFSTMRAAFAQFERETTAERVRDVMRSRAEQGKYNGGIAPYGYVADNKALKVDPLESAIVKKIFSLYLEYRSILSVTHKLNDEGPKTRKGELWSTTSIRRILTSSFYYGEVVYNKRSHTYRGELKHNPKEKYIKGNGSHQPLITKELFDKVQVVIQQQSRIAPKRNSKYLLTGLVYCSVCGSRMQGHQSKTNHVYYQCPGHTQKGNAKCPGNTIRVNVLDSLIVDNLKDLSINTNRIKEVLKETTALNNKDSHSINERIKAFQVQLEKAKIKRQRLFELYEGCSINKAEFLERKQLIDAEEIDVSKRLEDLRNRLGSSDIDSFDIDSVIGLCKDMKEVYDELDLTERKELVHNFLSEIKVNKHIVDYSIQIPPKLLSRAQDLGLCAVSSDTGRGSLPQPA